MPVTFEQLQVILLFIVPGFITDQFIGRSILRGPRGTTESILTYIAWSVCNLVGTAPVLMLLEQIPRSPWLEACKILFSTFAFPVAVGFIATKVYRWISNDPGNTCRLRKWLDRHDVLTIDPAPRAWDEVFFKLEKDSLVRVTLKDGRVVGGKYGCSSFASSDPSAQDIFIDEQWMLGPDGEFLMPMPNSKGILIMGSEIKFVEVFCNSNNSGGKRHHDQEERQTTLES